MNKISNKEQKEILLKARERYESATSEWSEQWRHVKEMRKMTTRGKQWDDAVKQRRISEGKPCLEYDMVSQFINRLVGDQQEQESIMEVSAIESDNDRIKGAGSRDYTQAEVIQGVLKNIQDSSFAKYNFNRAYKQVIRTGISFLVVESHYSDDDAFEQDLTIRSFIDQTCVLIDPTYKKIDASDIKWAFINDTMNKEEAEEKYPKANLVDSIDETSHLFDSRDTIGIIDYYYCVPIKDTLHLLNTGESVYGYKMEKVGDELASMGVYSERQRNVVRYEVRHAKINADFSEVLETSKWGGNTIPIRPLFGREIITDQGKKLYESAIARSVDAQVNYNFQRSVEAEIIASSPKPKWIKDVESTEGFEEDYKNNDGMEARYDSKGGLLSPPQWVYPANNPLAHITASARDYEDLKRSIGMYDESLGASTSSMSKIGMDFKVQQGDKTFAEFRNNLSMTIESFCKVIVNALPVYYDTQRVQRIVTVDGMEDYVQLNKTVIDEQTGEPVIINDIAYGKYDIKVKVGRSGTTRRQQAMEVFMELGRNNPVFANLFADKIVQGLDLIEGKDAVKRARSLLPKHFLTPEELEKMPQEPPSPEQQAAMAKSQSEQAKLQFEQAKLQSQSQIAQQETQIEQQKLALEEKRLELDMLKIQKELQQTPELVAGLKQEVAEMLGGLPELIDNRVSAVLSETMKPTN